MKSGYTPIPLLRQYLFRNRASRVFRCIPVLLFLLCPTLIVTINGQPVSDVYRVLMISNLNDVPVRSEKIPALKAHMNRIETPFSLVLNGDFSEDRFMAHAKDLAFWISRRPECRMIVLQGDRDWANSKKEGWEQIQRVERSIKSLNYANVLWINNNGCPGPEIVTLDNHVQFIGVNTQWFNHPFSKPSTEVGECEIADIDEFYEELEDLIDEHSDQNILIAGHMPVRSNGPFGGRFPLSQWVFPVPGVSGFLTSYKQNVGGSKEINNSHFSDFAEDMRDEIIERRTLIYASGHDKHTEILKTGKNYLINAGGFGETDYVKQSRFTVMKSEESGFVELIYVPDGAVESRFWKYEEGNGFSLDDDRILFQAPCEEPDPNIPVNERFVPCALELPVLEEMALDHPSYDTLPASVTYELTKFGEFIYGEHYRSTWFTPVTVPVLNLDTLENGIIPYSYGGGRNTKSLKFTSKTGKEYLFRTIDSEVDNSLKYDFKNTVIDVLIRGANSTQYPYGELVVPGFLDRLDILHTTPSLFVMPDDPKLGPWRKNFGGSMGYLMERPTEYARSKFQGADEIRRSAKLFKALYESPENRVAKNEYLKARLLDIYLGDWGRNENNWSWAGYRFGDGMLYRPVPLNRNYVFSKWDGVLPWLADREWAKSSGENFGEDIKDMRSLTFDSRHMDRFLLSDLGREEWLEASGDIRQAVEPEFIENIFDVVPEEVASLDSAEIISKLLKRRAKLDEFAIRYYELLAKEVDVVGTDENERFVVRRHEDGSVEVTMDESGAFSPLGKSRYHRVFNPEETDEIRLFGLSGDDIFILDGESKKSIKVRVVPGLGRDSIVDLSVVMKGGKRTVLYLNEISKDSVNYGPETREEKNADKRAYEYNRSAFQYNTYLPIPYIFYNSDRGMDFGLQFRFENYRYDQVEYSSDHRLGVRVSLNGNAAVFYEPRWNNVIGKCDIIGKFELEHNQNFNYYFGKGNFDPYDNSLLDDNYYTLNYSNYGLGVGLSNKFWKHAEWSALFLAYYATDQENDNTVADMEPDIIGLNSGFNTQMNLILDLDLRDSDDLPRTGYRLMLDNRIATDIQNDGGSFISSVAYVESWNTFHPIALGVRLGGLANIGDVPYYMNRYLGRNTFLRGFRQNRFLGDKAIYANTEARIELLNTKKTFVPLQFGLKVFFDAGKLFINGGEDSDWKIGYGGGVYFVPYKERLTLNLNAGFSEEESFLIQFTLGKPF